MSVEAEQRCKQQLLLYVSERAKPVAVAHPELALLGDGVLTERDLPQNNTLQYLI